MATSGTVSTTTFTNQQIIDHAFRRCKLVPQQIAGEEITTALDLLWLVTSTLVNKGIKLWNVDKIIVPLYNRVQSVPLPVGTVDILNMNLRTQSRITGTATASTGVAGNAFDGDLSTACTQTAINGTITMLLPSAQTISTFGILPNASGDWEFVIEGSNDNFTSATALVTKTVTVVDGEWLWYDVEGVADFLSYRLRSTSATAILDVTELVYQTTPQEIPMYQLNRDDYANLPDKTSTGRPTQFWWDKKRTQPIALMWPAPGPAFTYAQLTCYVQRYMDDVGSLTQELEVPQRWYMAMVCQLAAELGREIKEVDEALLPRLDQDARKYLNDAWDGESEGSDIFWRPNISPYTA